MRWGLPIAVICLSVIGLSRADDARASIRRPTHIEAQPLAAALESLARDRDIQVIYRSEVVTDRHTRGAVGEYTPEEALRKLLEGTGLTYRYLNATTVTILLPGETPGAGAPAIDAGPGSETGSAAPPATPSHATPAEAQEGKKRSSYTFRLAQAASGPDSVTAPMSASAHEGQAQLEEVVVTAQKRTESLQNVPIAVSALSSATLEALGAVDFTDYARTVPGLSFTDLGTGREIPAIRGINPSAGSPTVSFYIDETPIPAAQGNLMRSQANPDLIDLDRIEVLRGPQGTLYGSSSMGGTIRLIPTAPALNELEGWAELGATDTHTSGNAAGANATAVLNVPIVSGVLATRLAVWYRDDDGFITRRWGPNTTTDPTQFQGTQYNVASQDLRGGRLSLRYVPSEALEITGLLYRDERSANGLQDYTGGVLNPNQSLTQVELANVPEPSWTQFTLSNITAKLILGNVKLTSATSYYQSGLIVNEEGTAFADSVFGFIFPNHDQETHTDTNFTEELRIATNEPVGGLSAIGGLYFNEDHDHDFYDIAVPGWNAEFAPLGPTDPSGLYAQNNILYYGAFVEHERELSEFGELTYAFTSQLKLTGGVRHYDISNSLAGYSEGLYNNNETIPQSASGHYTGTLYKGTLAYQMTTDRLLYTTYSEGFRPGFGNYPLPPSCAASLQAAGLSAAPSQVNPDSVKNYEIGAKTQWFDRRLGLNVSVYHIDWTGIQQELFLSCGYPLYSNAGKAISNGAEIEIPAQFTQQLAGGISASYTQARLGQNEPAFQALRGDQIDDVPLWQASAHTDYSFPLSATLRGVARLNLQYTGSSYANYNRLPTSSERDPTYFLPSLLLLNGRFEVHQGRWSGALFADNLIDRTSRQDVQNSLIAQVPGRPRYVVNRPRMFGITIRKEF